MDVTREDLIKGPSVVIPPAKLMASSNGEKDLSVAETFAIAREKIKKHDHGVYDSDDEKVVKLSEIEPEYAFAFDIDGVLVKGGSVIPEAKEALRMLNGENEEGTKVPYIFVTNGGGKTEEERCIQLSKQLDVPVSTGQFICGHTPMQEMALKFGTVLVVGGEGEKCRHIAEGYGFKDVVTPGDLIKWRPSITPFRTLTDEEHRSSKVRDFSKVKFEAIFVFADSRDWSGDAQIIIELLMSKNGYLGTLSESYQEGPPIYFSHNDVVWATEYDLNRFGMGALRIMVESIYQAQTGKVVDITSYGKPQKGTFDYATRVLAQWRKDLGYDKKAPNTVYFVGDTPESDIRGTNEYDKHSPAEWHSILVKTGVYQADTIPAHTPRKTVSTVLDAVKYGMERERLRLLAKQQF